MGFIDATTLILAFTGEIKANRDIIDNINGNFWMFFINVICLFCYNITLCNNITFESQVTK